MKFLTTCSMTVLWIAVVSCRPIPLPVQPQRISDNGLDGLQDNVEQKGIRGRWLGSNLGDKANNAWRSVANWIAASPSPSIAVQKKKRDVYEPYGRAATMVIYDEMADRPFCFTEDLMTTTDDLTRTESVAATTPTTTATSSTPGILAKSVAATAKPEAQTPITTTRPTPHQQPRRRLPRIGVKFWSSKQSRLPTAAHGEISKET